MPFTLPRVSGAVIELQSRRCLRSGPHHDPPGVPGGAARPISNQSCMRPLVLILIGIVWTTAARAEPITVSAAVSLRDVLTDIVPPDVQSDGVEPKYNFASSGQLMGQIREGAPVDVFISASAKEVDALTADELADGATRVVIAGNALVLVVPVDMPNDRAPRRFEDLARASLKRLAIGDPDTVPAGDYAKQALSNLELFEALKARLVYGMHVRQVLDYVKRGEVDAGIVYRSDAVASDDKVRVAATADPSLHQPIDYVAVIVKASRNRAAAERFLGLLSTERAKEKFEGHGFIPATQPATDAAASP